MPGKQADDHHNKADQEHDKGDPVHAVHHADVNVTRFVGIPLAEIEINENLTPHNLEFNGAEAPKIKIPRNLVNWCASGYICIPFQGAPLREKGSFYHGGLAQLVRALAWHA